MVRLKYNHTLKLLTWPGKGRWEAISGPHGKGKLPNGIYRISRREITPYSSQVAKGFRDSSGNGFFVPIYPTFETSRGRSGGRLGIHPDGNTYGTLGCIGLRSNAKHFYDCIAATSAGASLEVEVVS